MEYSDFAIGQLVLRLAELSMKSSTPKRLAGLLFEAMEVIEQLRQQVSPPSEPLTLEEPMGLVRKYIVKKADTGEAVEDCFVLRPKRDWAARYAVKAYADITRNMDLRKDLLKWVETFPVSSYDPEDRSVPAGLDRIRWKGCYLCKGVTGWTQDLDGEHHEVEFLFCPVCGRPDRKSVV